MKSLSSNPYHLPNRLKILHVYPRLICGGVERVIEDIIRFSDPQRFKFDILTQEEGDNEALFEELGARILRLPYSGNDKDYRRRLRRILQEGEYTAVHCHSHREMSQVNLEAASLGIPVRIAHSHNAHQDIRGLRRLLRVLKFRRHARGATDLVGCSREALDWMFPMGGARRKIIHNGISSERFRFDSKARKEIREEFGIDESTRIILNIGRASEQKNQLHILRMAEADRNSDRLYVIIGQGPLLPSLKKKAEGLGLTNVRFLGERRDAEKWLSAADAFLFPSVFEGVGLAAMEAQAAGLGVVAGEIVPDEACMDTRLFRRIHGWSISDWLSALEDSLKDIITRDRRIEIPQESDSATTARRFCELYSPAEMIFCHPQEPAGISGGDRYNLKFVKAASKVLDSGVGTLVIDRSSGKTGGKLLLPWKTLKNIRRISRDYRRKNLKSPAWIFNTSKCLYLLPSLFYLRAHRATAIGITHHPLYIQMSGLKGKIYKIAELLFIKKLSVSVIPSEFTERILRREIKLQRLVRIPIPFDPPEYNEPVEKKEETDIKKSLVYNEISKKTRKFAKDCVKLLFIGTIEPRKGLTYLFEAMRLLQHEGLKINLKVAGKEVDQNYSESLRAMATEWNLDVSPEGYVSEDRKRRLLAEADIFVLPSEAEGFGIVLAEAMMASTPVVAFRNSGVIDVIGPDEERGMLAADRDAASLASAIRTLIENDALRSEKVRNAIEWTHRLSSTEDFEHAVGHLCGNILQS
ncbi:MAG: glycosyltransferase [Muribaculaceae bacterium]|nr:glycosyltransferase [Muribaculaceae bacterium]